MNTFNKKRYSWLDWAEKNKVLIPPQEYLSGSCSDFEKNKSRNMQLMDIFVTLRTKLKKHESIIFIYSIQIECKKYTQKSEAIIFSLKIFVQVPLDTSLDIKIFIQLWLNQPHHKTNCWMTIKSGLGYWRYFGNINSFLQDISCERIYLKEIFVLKLLQEYSV